MHSPCPAVEVLECHWSKYTAQWPPIIMCGSYYHLHTDIFAALTLSWWFLFFPLVALIYTLALPLVSHTVVLQLKNGQLKIYLHRPVSREWYETVRMEKEEWQERDGATVQETKKRENQRGNGWNWAEMLKRMKWEEGSWGHHLFSWMQRLRNTLK